MTAEEGDTVIIAAAAEAAAAEAVTTVARSSRMLFYQLCAFTPPPLISLLPPLHLHAARSRFSRAMLAARGKKARYAPYCYVVRVEMSANFCCPRAVRLWAHVVFLCPPSLPCIRSPCARLSSVLCGLDEESSNVKHVFLARVCRAIVSP